MKNTLFIYSTTDGHTIKIIEHMATQLRKLASADETDVVKVKPLASTSIEDLQNADRIVIGASIRYGHHKKEVFDFIETHLQLLNDTPSAFFSVNVVARKEDKNTPDSNPYLKKFVSLIKWQPDLLGVFAGRLAYPEYGFIDRTMIRFIMKMTKGPTDPTTVVEFTDWDKVDEFADAVARL